MKLIFVILLLGILTGMPEVSAKDKSNMQIDNSGTHNSILQEGSIPELMVQHKIKGNIVLVECIVNGITFRQSDHKNQKVGKIIVWIDGQRTSEVDAAAFIIKGLKPGTHNIKLEVVNLKNVPYGLNKEFSVRISE
ncbi:hypothetical protein [Neobacillus mesonae]|uniref:hypothetical protein n=1 Tax=Neobacillus mesonae TaxID=1193713 RepID=UPI0020421F2C|nr:hypothetical protein [Neobacillus mesonae]MCM3568783.1 hypothetical protein [Neobacillus mesonae]